MTRLYIYDIQFITIVFNYMTEKDIKNAVSERIFHSQRPKDGWKLFVLFFLLWVLISVGVFSAFYFLKAVPEQVQELTAGVINAVSKEPPVIPSFSQDSAIIEIPRIGIVSPIAFPKSKEFGVLKQALDTGVVHYPDSALPGNNGNVFLFGHSSSRIYESNPYRKIFTRLNELVAGDEIVIKSSGVEYRYRVVLVSILKPQEAKIYFATPQPKLTLSTCWPVGDPKNRFVVEAEFMGQSLVNES